MFSLLLQVGLHLQSISMNISLEYNKEIGYCQGMNYIAGLIVLVVREEEKAFWLLVCLIEVKYISFHAA